MFCLILDDRLRVTAHIAGHVLGAVMWEVQIDDRTILYTGDYSEDGTKFIPSYQLPQHFLLPNRLDMLIMECTYGNTDFKSFKTRQTELVHIVIETIRKRGKVLIPCYAIGFTQEVIVLIQQALLQEGMKAPIYCSSSDSLSVLPMYQFFSTWVSGTLSSKSETIQQFRTDFLDSPNPFILFASSATMTTGVSRTAFERFATNPLNTVIFLGQNSPESFIGQMLKEGAKLNGETPVLCNRVVIPFSAHPDRKTNIRLIERSHPQSVVLIHGDKNNCAGFIKYYLTSHKESPLLLMPENGRTVQYIPEAQRVRMSLKQAVHVRREGEKRLCIEQMLRCENGRAYLEDGVAVPLWNAVTLPCTTEKAKEIMSQLEAKQDTVHVQYEDGVIRITWLEGYQHEATALITMIFRVCKQTQ